MPILAVKILLVLFWSLWLAAFCATAIALGQAYFQRNNDHNDP